MIELETSRIRPELYGPTATLKLRKTLKISLILSMLLSISSVILLFYNYIIASYIALASIITLALGYSARHFWRIIVGRGIDSEIPTFLAFLLPYSSSPRYLTDVIVRLPRKYFRWTYLEAERLKLLLDVGNDPIQALREIAKTTPSQRLRRVFTDYVHSLVTGAPRSHVTLLLLDHAVEGVRAQWRTYTEVARVVVEALTGILIASVALAPMALFTGDVDARLLLIPLALSPLAGVLLLLSRPRVGDHRPSTIWTLAIVAGIMVSTIAYYSKGLLAGLLSLVPTLIVGELAHRLWENREEHAITKLREAADDAKYGRPFDETLEEARRLAPRLLSALVDAAKVAGRIGVGDSLIHVYRVVEEARTARRSLRMQGWILSVLAAIAPAISVYLLVYIAGLSTGDILAGNPKALIEAARLLAALSPLAPLPAVLAARGWIPSAVPSLLSLLLSHYVLTVSV